MKVNLEAFDPHRTIEFRQHGGTVEAEKAVPWIRFCLGFVEQSRKVAQATNTAALIPADTKIGTLVAMLSRMGGASVDDLVAATGWQRHTIRGAISSQLRKRGLQVISRRQNGTTVYPDQSRGGGRGSCLRRNRRAYVSNVDRDRRPNVDHTSG
jgi:Protein of unknown function (DUF3489)/Putative amidoligase enzyme